MALRTIIYLPDPRLRAPTKDITEFDHAFSDLIDDMFETMYHARGVGLAAPQIGLSLNVAVMDVVGDKSQQIVMANPEIIHREGSEMMSEGCLSVPGAWDTVKRSAKVKIRAQDRQGEFYEMEGDGLLGECMQHEIDHLHGKLFVDLLSPLKRQMAKRKLEKHKRTQGKG
jgi:peptide deformylase